MQLTGVVRTLALAGVPLVLAGAVGVSSSQASHGQRVTQIQVIVRAEQGNLRQAELAVRRAGGRLVRALPLVDGFSAQVARGSVARLRSTAGVATVTLDSRISASSLDDECPAEAPTCIDGLDPDLDWQKAIRLDEVPTRYDGSSATVAVLDTGITPADDLESQHQSRVLARVDLTGEHDGLDHYGHGTHMAGLVAGNGSKDTDYKGAAGEAKLVSVKVAGWDGSTDVSAVIAGMQWIVANADRYGIRVLNLSFGTDSAQDPAVDPLDDAVERVWAAGILVVVSAGNRGAEGITKPGDDPYVLTVGAADLNGTESVVDDEVAPFSSTGPGKPDLAAPGVSLVSLRASGSTLDTFRPLARIRGGYFKGTGTSQAAAIVSGVAARMFDANASLTPNQAKAVLIRTANDALGGAGAGAGLLDARAAVEAVAPTQIRGGFVQRRIDPANVGLSRSTGAGSLDASRGATHIATDLDADGAPDLIQGELDALGAPWSAAAADASWQPGAWARSAWAKRTAEIPGWSPAPPWAGPSTGLMAWEAKYWGAADWMTAGWDAKYWGAKYWGADTWG